MQPPAGLPTRVLARCKLQADRKNFNGIRFFRCIFEPDRPIITIIMRLTGKNGFLTRVTIWGRFLSAAGLLVLMFLAGRVDACSITYENGIETVYWDGEQFPSAQSSPVRKRHSAKHVRRHRHRKHRRGPQVSYNNDVISISDNAPVSVPDGGSISDNAPVSVPDGGSTLAMFGSATLLLLGYHWLRCKRIAA
jgi:hypothetical protein